MNKNKIIGVTIGVVVGIILIIAIIAYIFKSIKKDNKTNYIKQTGGGLTDYDKFVLDSNQMVLIFGWDRVEDFITWFNKLPEETYKKYLELLPNIANLMKKWMTYKTKAEDGTEITYKQDIDNRIEKSLSYIFKNVKIYENQRDLITYYNLYKQSKKDEKEPNKFKYHRTDIIKIKNSISRLSSLITNLSDSVSSSNDLLIKSYISTEEFNRIKDIFDNYIKTIDDVLKNLKDKNDITKDYEEKLNKILNEINENDKIHPYTQSRMYKLSDFNPVLADLLKIMGTNELKDNIVKLTNSNYKFISKNEVIYQDNITTTLLHTEKLFTNEFNEKDMSDNFERFWYSKQKEDGTIVVRELIDKLAMSNTSMSHDDHYPASLHKWNLFVTVVRAVLNNQKIFDDGHSNELKILTDTMEYQRNNMFLINMLINALSPPNRNFAKGHTFKHTFM